MSYVEHLTGHLRLSILRALADGEGGYSANCSILTDVVNGYGITAARDQVRTQMHWLQDQGLLSVEQVGSVLVGRITEAGMDVARGRRQVPGVRRPGPGQL